MTQPFFVNDVLQYKTQGSVLDLGCNVGDQAIFLAEHGFRVTAVDKDVDALQKLGERANISHVEIDVVNHDVATFKPTKSFDVILALGILHFLNAKEVPEVIAIMKEHTNPDGINVMMVHTDQNPPNHRPYLFKQNEIISYYADWKILKHVEGLGKPYVRKTTYEGSAPTGTCAQNYRAILIAQKSKI